LLVIKITILKVTLEFLLPVFGKQSTKRTVLKTVTNVWRKGYFSA